jgi:hypothetical protein
MLKNGGGGGRLSLAQKNINHFALRHYQDTHCAYWTVFLSLPSVCFMRSACALCTVQNTKNRHNEFGVILQCWNFRTIYRG